MGDGEGSGTERKRAIMAQVQRSSDRERQKILTRQAEEFCESLRIPLYGKYLPSLLVFRDLLEEECQEHFPEGFTLYVRPMPANEEVLKEQVVGKRPQAFLVQVSLVDGKVHVYYTRQRFLDLRQHDT